MASLEELRQCRMPRTLPRTLRPTFRSEKRFFSLFLEEPGVPLTLEPGGGVTEEGGF